MLNVEIEAKLGSKDALKKVTKLGHFSSDIHQSNYNNNLHMLAHLRAKH